MLDAFIKSASRKPLGLPVRTNRRRLIVLVGNNMNLTMRFRFELFLPGNKQYKFPDKTGELAGK
jgi:hypothetical protein